MPSPIDLDLLRAIEALPEPLRTSIITGLREVSEGKTTPAEMRSHLIEKIGVDPMLVLKIFPNDD